MPRSPAAQERAAHESAVQKVPVRALTALQNENAEAVLAQLRSECSEAQEGDFEYRVLPDGTAVIIGYYGDAANVTVPQTLGGAAVTGLASGAFGAGVREVTIHGDVAYIAGDAVALGTTVNAWQGSYAAAWAQALMGGYVSKTPGVLNDDFVDMSDVLQGIHVLSDSMVTMSAVTAKRLAVGSRFLLYRSDEDERFFTVTAMRPRGSKVYVSVAPVEVEEVYRYRIYEGTKTVTNTQTVTSESGVDQTEGELSAASVELESAEETKENTWAFKPDVSVNFKKVKLDVKATITTAVTSKYRLEIDNGDIIGGDIVNDEKTTCTVKITVKGGD